MNRIIHIQADAPLKPAWGKPCNGCGVCCLVAPCPIGILVSRRRSGACAALRWRAPQRRYVCGLMAEPESFVRPRWAAAGIARLARRMIAAGSGCDSDVTLEGDAPAP
jgi:hypothetical protein